MLLFYQFSLQPIILICFRMIKIKCSIIFKWSWITRLSEQWSFMFLWYLSSSQKNLMNLVLWCGCEVGTLFCLYKANRETKSTVKMWAKTTGKSIAKLEENPSFPASRCYTMVIGPSSWKIHYTGTDYLSRSFPKCSSQLANTLQMKVSLLSSCVFLKHLHSYAKELKVCTIFVQDLSRKSDPKVKKHKRRIIKIEHYFT